ncbi:hypothetical protein NP284_13020 [Rhodopseudomonas pseudopalustris]|uniref:hypothetical protein n=1 Tax=Rhodopseudomonas pseudopalustris TaxID=1513892 RepID=UPI003F97689B
MFHLISIWLTRIVVMGVAIALAVMYVIPAYFGEQQPATGSASLPAARPAAPMAPLAPAALAPPSNDQAAVAAPQPSSEPVAAANNAEPASDTTPVTDADSNARPCQPIARTASGDLVYSMDCRRLPAE